MAVGTKPWLCEKCGHHTMPEYTVCGDCGRKRPTNKRPPTEEWVKLEIKKILKPLRPDLWYYMPPASGYGRSGIPDFVVCYKGKFLGIEAKANGNTATEIQQGVHDKVRVAGGRVCIIDENGLESLKIILAGM